MDKNGKTTREKDFFDKSPNRSQKSVSPSAAYLDKYKLPNKQTTMKTSFAGAAVPDKKEKDKEKETHVSPTTPDIKKDKDKDKEKDNSK